MLRLFSIEFSRFCKLPFESDESSESNVPGDLDVLMKPRWVRKNSSKVVDLGENPMPLLEIVLASTGNSLVFVDEVYSMVFWNETGSFHRSAERLLAR